MPAAPLITTGIGDSFVIISYRFRFWILDFGFWIAPLRQWISDWEIRLSTPSFPPHPLTPTSLDQTLEIPCHVLSL
ncbi:MAG TPA: hypothetical protein DD379_00030 [Cyanobacteria bacterium UBA11162]|nr:hypothetical protein [Cyanobacteria bacterium UBA11162]